MHIQTSLQWIEQAETMGAVSNFNGTIMVDVVPSHLPCYEQSVQTLQEHVFILIFLHNMGDRHLLIFGDDPTLFSFEGEVYRRTTYLVQCCTINAHNSIMLRKHFPHTAPSAVLSSSISVGLGDRLGIATAGHLALVREYAIAPVLAQQSMRELTLTKRTYTDVIDEVSWDVFAFNFRIPWGADGDHLKTTKEVADALSMGCTMITADVSDSICGDFEKCDETTLLQAYEKLDTQYRHEIESLYMNGAIPLLDTTTIVFSKQTLMRASLTYRDAIVHARNLYAQTLNHSDNNKTIDFEVSVDETRLPTTPQAHFFVAHELQRSGVVFQSLAPRFYGEFQKGIDYKGDIDTFSQEIAIHQCIAKCLGYKLSIHSGSDKFSIFPIICDTLDGAFHIKTSGTNWLVALYTVATVDAALFRMLYNKAYEAFDIARAYYHITPDFTKKVSIENINDSLLPTVFDNPCDRQVLHIAYGEILKDEYLYNALFSVLHEHLAMYWKHLNQHIGRHITLLGIPAR